MAVIYLATVINAAPQLVFDLSLSVDLHRASMTNYREEIIDGIQHGCMNKGDTVTWKAAHFFKTRTLKVRLTKLDSPHVFVDEMIEGDFKKMRHEHRFKPIDNGTLMIDRFLFETPFGIVGKLINFLFLKTYMKRLLEKRNNVIKHIAETDLWKQYLHT